MKDEASGYRMVRFIKSTVEVAKALKSMLDEAERQTGRKALSLRTDNGTEYVNAAVTELLAGVENESRRLTSSRQTGSQNERTGFSATQHDRCSLLLT